MHDIWSRSLDSPARWFLASLLAAYVVAKTVKGNMHFCFFVFVVVVVVVVAACGKWFGV